MLVRRLLEWAIFIFYWLGFAPIAIYSIYHRILIQEYNVQDKLGRFQSLGLFLLILVVLYLIVRYLALMLYAKCRLREKRLMHNMKKEVRALKSDVNGQTNLAYENEKQLRKSKKYRRSLRRGQSLDDLNQYQAESGPIKTTKSLENMVRQTQRQRKRYRENDYSQNSVLFYEVVPTPTSSYHQQQHESQRFNTPPPAYHSLNNEEYFVMTNNSDDEYEIYSKVNSQRRPKFRMIRSADDVLENSRVENVPARTAHSCDEVDGVVVSNKILRKAPPPPALPTRVRGDRRSRSLTRVTNKSRMDDIYADDAAKSAAYRSRSLKRLNLPAQQHTVEIHQPTFHQINMPARLGSVKRVLVSNIYGPQKL